MPSGNTSSLNFYPRSPYGERQSYHQLTHHQSVFLSTLSLRRATRGGDLCYLDNIISIHALLTESDAWNRFTQRRDFISIHALLTESDLIFPPVDTSSVSISIHALLTESDTPKYPKGYRWQNISIHALLTESDIYVTKFYRPAQISIHALLTESDSVACGRYYQRHYFYPRSPYGERPACRSADTGCP